MLEPPAALRQAACIRAHTDDRLVYCVGIDFAGDAPAWHAAALPYVTATELARSRRYLHAIDATRHLVGRALLRNVLQGALGPARPADLPCNAWGKPGLPGAALEFSIAHSGDAVWVALSRAGAVGIDVEQDHPQLELAGLTEMLHPDEQAQLAALAAPLAHAAFMRCWSRKEAVIKAIGEGLSRPLNSFAVDTSFAATNWLRTPPQSGCSWSVADLPVAPGYRASVAVIAPAVAVQWHRPDLAPALQG